MNSYSQMEQCKAMDLLLELEVEIRSFAKTKESALATIKLYECCLWIEKHFESLLEEKKENK